MRFLHLADLHLDTSFAGRGPAVAARLRRALRDTLARAIDVSLELQLDAVLVAGDLFDGPLLTFDTERFLATQIERLQTAGIPFLYATGNHDPANTLPVSSWPTNAVVFSSPQPQTVCLRDRSGETIATVTGAGHDSERVAANLAREFPAWEPSSCPRIALLHALVDGARAGESHDRFAPCGRTDLRAKGYDYWALGHVHERQIACEDPLAVYPGNPQGRSPRESGARGAYVVSLRAGETPQISFVALAAVRWETVSIDGLEATREFSDLLTTLRSTVAEALRHRSDPDPRDAISLRVALVGGCPLFRELRSPENLRFLCEELRRSLRDDGPELTGVVEFVDVELDARVNRPVDVNRLRERNDVLGEALRLVEALRSGATALPNIEAEELAGATEGASSADYIRSLLTDADPFLAERLLLVEP
ncbi:MAG: exonuclease SbcCD subunit D [Planctomycetota bacterium]